MSADGISDGIVTKTELAELADLFDKFEFAFDPRSRQAKEAESEFENRLQQIFEEKITQAYPQVAFVVFSCKMKSLCRSYLKKNTT